MSAKILYGAPVTERLTSNLATLIEASKTKPTVALLDASLEPPEVADGFLRALAAVGIDARVYRFSESSSEREFKETIEFIERSSRFSAFLVQKPLKAAFRNLLWESDLSPALDVDGVLPQSLCGTFKAGEAPLPPTVQACLTLLDHYRIPVAGRRTLVVGRSQDLGRPLALGLIGKDATVTVCHRQTRGLENLTRQSEILIMATGEPKLLKAHMVAPGATVIDYGATVTGGKVCGDVDFDAVRMVAGAVSPCPGGVGPIVTAHRLQRCVKICLSRSL